MRSECVFVLDYMTVLILKLRSKSNVLIFNRPISRLDLSFGKVNDSDRFLDKI